MNKLFLKISDFLLCFMGTLFILAGIVTFNRSSGKYSPFSLFHHTESYPVAEKVVRIFK
jgi:hypothetical protein